MAYIYRMYVFYNMDLFDFTRCQMVMTMKFMQLGYNLYDGYIYTTGSTNATIQFEGKKDCDLGISGNDCSGSSSSNRKSSSSSNNGKSSSSSNSSSSNNNSITSSSTGKLSQGLSMRQQVYMDHMHRQRRLCAIVHPPRLLPYCGYMFGVTGVLLLFHYLPPPLPLTLLTFLPPMLYPPRPCVSSYDHNPPYHLTYHILWFCVPVVFPPFLRCTCMNE